jgi:hypothetical protein
MFASGWWFILIKCITPVPKVKVTWVTPFDEEWFKCQDDELRMNGTPQQTPYPPPLPNFPTWNKNSLVVRRMWLKGRCWPWSLTICVPEELLQKLPGADRSTPRQCCKKSLQCEISGFHSCVLETYFHACNAVSWVNVPRHFERK